MVLFSLLKISLKTGAELAGIKPVHVVVRMLGPQFQRRTKLAARPVNPKESENDCHVT